MTVRLRDEDRRAVDLLLDRAASGAGNGTNGNGNGIGNGHTHAGAFTPVSGDVQARVPAVQKVLQLLDLMPPEEPPRDLLAQTLRRLDIAAMNHPSVLRAPQPPIGTDLHQPHA